MNRDRKAGVIRDRVTVTKSRDDAVAEGARSAPNIATIQTRPRLLDATPRGTISLVGETGRSLVIDAIAVTRDATRGLVMSLLKISPVLASFVCCVLVPTFSSSFPPM